MTYLRWFILLLLCQGFQGILFSQKDTLYTKKNKALLMSVEGRARHQVYSLGKRVINDERSLTVTDNPFVHMAVYSSAELEYIMDKKYSFIFNLVSEERGYSSGNNILDNLVLFPKILFKMQDSIIINDLPITIACRAGDIWAEDWSDIIRFYNIDFQAFDLNIRKGKWMLGYARIADLSNNIGVGLEETGKMYFGLVYPGSLIQCSWEADNVLKPAYHRANLFSLFFRKNKGKETAYEFQFSLQSKNEFNPSIGLALATTFHLKNSPRFHLKSSLRYFTKDFNHGYDSRNKINYRGFSTGIFKGKQLYPLKNFYRDMNQWALFTAYENQNILALECVAAYCLPLIKKTAFFFNSDVNIFWHNKDVAVLPGYDVGLSILPLESLEFRFGITNKHMNLDSFFQTFYFSQMPVFCFNAHKKI